MLQPSLVPSTSFAERLRARAGPRALAISLTLLIEALLLLLLLSFRSEDQPGGAEKRLTVVNIGEASEEAPEPDSPEREQRTEETSAAEEPEAPQPAEPLPPEIVQAEAAPIPPVVLPAPNQRPAATPQTATRPAPKPKRVYGPPNKGGSAASRDTEVVGTAPNGEPLYAAAWYREPKPGELGPYLSTARGPGWGLIACRTAPDFRVEDCVGLSEYPEGSQINRAVLAAAWEFRVRPPRRGGQLLVGSWVRIRIDYGIERR